WYPRISSRLRAAGRCGSMCEWGSKIGQPASSSNSSLACGSWGAIMLRADVIMSDSKEVAVRASRTGPDRSSAARQMVRLAERHRFVQEKWKDRAAHERARDRRRNIGTH